MSEVAHSLHHPLFATTGQRRLSSSVMAGLGIAALLHAGIAVYLFNQNFQIIEPPTLPPEVITKGVMVRFAPPPPTPQPKSPPIDLHKSPITPLAPPPIPVEPSPVDAGPVVTTSPPVTITTGAPTEITGTSSQPAANPYVKAQWASYPTGEAALSYYPKRALDGEVEGEALVECTFNAIGKITACAVLSENPAKYGFGQATVDLLVTHARAKPQTANGALRDGDKMKIRYRWSLD
ncbi:energy transducer TonB [Asticcacaulis sp. ZE23SCel15]|uniref:energy transducer TonB n=1 Tax=Asticcacaulis sp. ZE23SCel15 TaxID=3059027 RepID=UPI00265E1109|nr:energy transducer TonB [Asticcacaulis sp. ZE23SCel15]WKL56167.1 energy transducer TonB [Asticcacaulis sp. ZE23SCel15]